MLRKLMVGLVAAALLELAGCMAPDHSAYRTYLQHMPRSILVLPPINHSANVHASDAFMATVTAPLCENGYYVYPLAVVDRLFKENGVPTPGDMHSIPLSKIREIIGPDAVLYIHIKQWTTTYVVIDSTTSVTMDYKLVDTASGETLWAQSQTCRYSSSSGQSDPIAMVIAAQLHAIAVASSNGAYERDAARSANVIVFDNPGSGLLKGSRHKEFAQDQVRIKEQLAREDATKTGS